ncbi:MAG: hypothetical protein IJE09_00930 [Oscillospiraceae bacterium]|nr:hypothetical protein [Oscillospiraceae bacterium]
MFGYLVAASEILDEEQKERYRECYCGLCRSLQHEYGEAARLSLNYDITFLVLLLSSLYEPDEENSKQRCLRHPIEARSFSRSEISDYAAGMNVALAYLKCLDNWKDDKKISALMEAKLLEAAYKKACAAWPRQCEAISRAMDDLAKIEAAGLDAPDAAADCFGRLMEEIFVYRQDRWETTLRAMARALGRFIYLIDAAMDLDDDHASGSYNPFSSYYGLEDNSTRFQDILKMQLGECIYYYDKLPLVEDTALMQNILCVGLWLQFNKKFSRKDS